MLRNFRIFRGDSEQGELVDFKVNVDKAGT